MKQILNTLYNHQLLSKEQAKEVLTNISTNTYNSAQIASIILVYLMRGISVEELSGFREALLEVAVPLDVRGQDTIVAQVETVKTHLTYQLLHLLS